jgi:hypothetical protein
MLTVTITIHITFPAIPQFHQILTFPAPLLAADIHVDINIRLRGSQRDLEQGMMVDIEDMQVDMQVGMEGDIEMDY